MGSLQCFKRWSVHKIFFKLLLFVALSPQKCPARSTIIILTPPERRGREIIYIRNLLHMFKHFPFGSRGKGFLECQPLVVWQDRDD